jgi:hypothetical protein
MSTSILFDVVSLSLCDRWQNGEVRDMLKVPPPVPMVYTAVNK